MLERPIKFGLLGGEAGIFRQKHLCVVCIFFDKRDEGNSNLLTVKIEISHPDAANYKWSFRFLRVTQYYVILLSTMEKSLTPIPQ